MLDLPYFPNITIIRTRHQLTKDLLKNYFWNWNSIGKFMIINFLQKGGVNNDNWLFTAFLIIKF